MKYAGIVKISNPTAVQARLGAGGDTSSYHKGAIYVECPELGFENPNLLYCRYALSLPYVKVKDGDYIWIESTVAEVEFLNTERWIYTGFRDCSGRDSISPDSTDQLIIESEEGKHSITIGTVISIMIDSIAKTYEITCGSSTIKLDNQKAVINNNFEVTT